MTDQEAEEQVLSEMFEKSAALIRELRAENKELTAWKESMMTLWSPVIDYCQQHGDELGIKLGESISEYILKMLKERL